MKSLVEFLTEAKEKGAMVYHKRSGRNSDSSIINYLYGLEEEACKEQGIKFDKDDSEDIIAHGDEYLQGLQGILTFVFGQVYTPRCFSVTSTDTDIPIYTNDEGDYFRDATNKIICEQDPGYNSVVVDRKQNLILNFDDKFVYIIKKGTDPKAEKLKWVDLEGKDFETCGEYFKYALNENNITEFDKLFDNPSVEVYISERDY